MSVDAARADAAALSAWCADLLTLGRPLGRWSAMLALLALVGLFVDAAGRPWLSGSLVAALAVQGYGLRVRVDEAVFRRWGQAWVLAGVADPLRDMGAFDRARGFRGVARSLEQRCAGARRLLWRQGALVLLQTACVATAAILEAR